MKEIIYRPCAVEHIALIKPQNGNLLEKEYFMSPGFIHMVRDHFAISAWVDNTCVMAAGYVMLYKHRYVAWALVGEQAGPYMRRLTAKVKGALDLCPGKRVEMMVDADFDAGHRWAKMLGFEVEAQRMKCSGVFGGDETLYARVKE